MPIAANRNEARRESRTPNQEESQDEPYDASNPSGVALKPLSDTLSRIGIICQQTRCTRSCGSDLIQLFRYWLTDAEEGAPVTIFALSTPSTRIPAGDHPSSSGRESATRLPVRFSSSRRGSR